MNWFTRKKRTANAVKSTNPPVATASTFVEATGGGWTDPPDIIEIDGGSQAYYIGVMLARAKQQAIDSVKVGETFTYTMTDIPVGFGPHEIMLPLMMRAFDYGLECQSVTNDTVQFARRN